MTRKIIVVAMIALLMQSSLMAAENDQVILTLKKAEAQALQNDARLQQAQAEVSSSQSRTISAAQLPDPRLTLAALNLPTDTFDLGQEAMTNMKVGIQQSFPAGDSLQIRQAKAEAKMQLEAARIPQLKAQILRELRGQWLTAWAGQAEQHLLLKQRRVLRSLLPAVKGAYRAGRGNQSDVTRIRLQLARLLDEAAKLQGSQDTGLAGLSQWEINTSGELPENLPETLTKIPEGAVQDHPELRVSEARVGISREQIALDKQAYKPAWGLEASYGWRENRADLFSVGVSLTLPLFADKRQDPQVAASQKKYLAAREAVRDTRANLETRKSSAEVSISALDKRIDNYQTGIIPQLKTLRTLARSEYRSGRSDFDQALKTEEDLIKAGRSVLSLQVERARKIIELRYLLEEVQS